MIWDAGVGRVAFLIFLLKRIGFLCSCSPSRRRCPDDEGDDDEGDNDGDEDSGVEIRMMRMILLIMMTIITAMAMKMMTTMMIMMITIIMKKTKRGTQPL